MGMFDSVYFKCPECDESIEVQTKVSDCTLRSIDEEAVPVDIAQDIVGECVHCKCGYIGEVGLLAHIPETVGMRLL